MRPGVPWSVKGIDDQARQAAKQAARDAGLTLGQWLNSVILDTAEGPPLSGDKQDAGGKSGSGAQSARFGDSEIKDKLDQLADQLSSLTQQSQDTAVSRFIKPDAEVGSLEAIIDRIETNERRSDAAFEVVNKRLEEMTDKLDSHGAAAFPERPEDVPGFSALESALRNIVDHVEVSERRTVETLTVIQQRMADIASRATGAQDDDIIASAPAITSLEQRVSELTDRLEEGRAEAPHNLKSYVDSHVDQLSQRIDAALHSADAVNETVQSIAVETAQEHTRGLEDQLEGIVARLEQSGSAAPDTSHLQAEIDDLNQRFEAIKDEAASERDVQTLRAAIEKLTSQISTGPDLSPIGDIEQRLSELTARLEESAGADGIPPQVSDLDQRVQDLDTRLQQVMTGQSADGPGNDALVDQIASVADRLTATEQKLGHLETIERSITQLFDSVEQNRVWAKEAAEEVAARMVSQVPTDGSAGVQFAPSEELQALQEGLSAVKASAELSDQRNQETLEAVHDTLEQIIEKLTDLELHDIAAMPAAHTMAQPAAPAPEAHEPSVMPADIAGLQSAIAQSVGSDPDALAQPEPFDTHYQPAEMPPSAELGSPIDSQFAAPDVADIAHEPVAPPQSYEPPEPEVAPAPEREDFIAAARRAAQDAASQSTVAKLSGLANTSRRESVLGSDEDEGGSGSRFSLSFLRRKKPDLDDIEDDMPPSAMDHGDDADVEETDSSGKRRQLILAGLVLLAAVSAYSVGGLGKKSLLPFFSSSNSGALEQPAKTSLMTSPQTVRHGSATAKHGKPSSAVMSAVDALIRPAGNPSAASQHNKQSESELYTAAISALPTPPALPDLDIYSAQQIPAIPTNDLHRRPSAGTGDAPRMTGVTTLTKAVPAAGHDALPEQLGSDSLRQAAIAGDANAQFVIASRYLEGKMVSQDFKQAAEWYRRAAVQGLAPAQYRLGTMFERGRGLPKDLTAARLWYERAAERDNVKAMHNLAVIYANNEDGSAQFDKAAKWFRAAAEHGLRDSLYNLAVLYERGLGQAKDLLKAYFWFGVAARHQDADASARMNGMKTLVSQADRARLDRDIAAWVATKPDNAGNIVAITDPSWQVAGAHTSETLPAPAPPPPQLSGGQLILKAQELLTDMGYDVGPKDGVLGSRTANAVRLFQLQAGMPVNGTVSAELISLLESRRS